MGIQRDRERCIHTKDIADSHCFDESKNWHNDISGSDYLKRDSEFLINGYKWQHGAQMIPVRGRSRDPDSAGLSSCVLYRGYSKTDRFT